MCIRLCVSVIEKTFAEGSGINSHLSVPMKFLNLIAGIAILLLGLTSCGGGPKNIVIPRAMSTADAVTLSALNLTQSDYNILNTVTETASVECDYRGSSMVIRDTNGEFEYRFICNSDGIWTLKSFNGVAVMGYFAADFENPEFATPNPGEFSRRVAMGRIIRALQDYNADAVVEPVTSSSVAQSGRNKIVYTTTVSAKLVKLRTH